MSNITRTFNGTSIAQRLDGYLNATAMCKANGKEWSNYRQNATTDAFLTELESVLGIPRTALIVTVQGGTPELQGTFVHPQVAYHLAMWCSPAFAVQVTEWIHDIRTKGFATAKPVEVTGAANTGSFDTVGSAWKAFYEIAGHFFPDHNQRLLSVNKAVLTHTGIDAMASLNTKALPAPTQERLMTVTELGRDLGLSAQATNALLIEYGFQRRVTLPNGRHEYEPRQEGLKLAVFLDTGKRHSNGTPVRQLKWKTSVGAWLLGLISPEEAKAA